MIINFLVKALCEKESVYVNNLGLFRKEYAPAQIKDGMITPPGYRLVYDPDFDGNGFAFTMFVSQKGGMLITEATNRIDQWVEQLKTALDHNKSVSFGNFGTFAKNDHGAINFVCDRIAELNVEYEGMEPVSLDSKKALAEEEVETDDEMESKTEGTSVKTSKNIEEETSSSEEDSTQTEKKDAPTEGETESDVEGVKTENSESTEESENTEESEKTEEIDEENDVNEDENENDEDEDDNEEETEDQKRKKHPWLVILIILLIAALLAAAAYYFREQLTELYQQYFGPKNTEQVPEEPLQDSPSTVVIDTIKTDSLDVEIDSLNTMDNSENIEEEVVSEPNVVNQLPSGEKFFIDYEKGKFYVIVGSFRSEKEVREHIKSRKLEQYNPKVVLQQNSKNLRVCIGVFDTEAAADSYGHGTGLNYWVLK